MSKRMSQYRQQVANEFQGSKPFDHHKVLRTRPSVSVLRSNIHEGLTDIASTSLDDSRLVK
ncbi:hypothetical protein GBA52_021647 [Prunus armeniaca]|nr:hypothetical protein GBA52_021647 [Prunus armeniaca]